MVNPISPQQSVTEHPLLVTLCFLHSSPCTSEFSSMQVCKAFHYSFGMALRFEVRMDIAHHV